MSEMVLFPGLYYTGKDIPAGAYVFMLTPDNRCANLTLLKPSQLQYNWFLSEPNTQVRLRLEDKMVFRLDRPVTIRCADDLEWNTAEEDAMKEV